jgi:ABC-type transporter Mla maintaining outer membrane lipid asymmetry ATPase subunit MlaF
MTDALAIDDVITASGASIDCRLGVGQRVRILCGTDDARTSLLATLSGMVAPHGGRLRYFGRDPYAMRNDEMLELYRRVGIVPGEGGLISNLKAWENVVLPSWYHDGRDASALEAKAAELFQALGFTTERLRGFLALLPERLSIHEARGTAFVRTWLMEPEIVIYDAPFSGLERATAQRWLDALNAFHAERTHRISIYLLPDDAFSERVDADKTVLLKKG